MVALVGETFGGGAVVGAGLSVRAKETMIMVWLRDGGDDQGSTLIGCAATAHCPASNCRLTPPHVMQGTVVYNTRVAACG